MSLAAIFSPAPLARAFRAVAAACLADPPALWIVLHRGEAVGSLFYEVEGLRARWRLDWFGNADARLRGYADLHDGDTVALANALAHRLGESDAIAARLRIVATPD